MEPEIPLQVGESIRENYPDNTFRVITLEKLENLGEWKPEINLKNPDFEIKLDVCFNMPNNK